MRPDGLPALALTEVAVTPDERADGRHYALAEADLLGRGFEEPFVHFAGPESPPFLVPAVRQYLAATGGDPAAPKPVTPEGR
jgi:hypothetical protein